MAVPFIDYYQILDIDRKATNQEVSAAYRKMARQWHPDLQPADKKKEAEEKFKQVNEAYEVLKDSEKRAKYDRLGSRWKEEEGVSYQQANQYRPGSGGGHFYTESDPGGFSEFFKQFFGGGTGGFGSGMGGSTSSRARKVMRGEDIESELELSLEEAYHGVSKSLRVNDRSICGSCGGIGSRDRSFCPQCGGTGSITREKALEVKIPPGVRDGSRIRLKEQGGEGLGGASRGDLFLKVRLRPHPHFRIKDADVETKVVLGPEQAVLGAKVTVPTLDGEIYLNVPPGSRTGTRLRLRGKGFPLQGGGRGDQYTRIVIDIPAEISVEQKELYRRLEALGKGGG